MPLFTQSERRSQDCSGNLTDEAATLDRELESVELQLLNGAGDSLENLTSLAI